MLTVFAENGANIWALARSHTPEFLTLCEDTASKHAVSVWPLFFELTDSEAMKAVVKQIMVTKHPMDALINNAGIMYNALFQMSRLEDVRTQMEVNFFASYLLTQYVSKLMVRRKKGSIVNIASTAVFDKYPGKSAYVADCMETGWAGRSNTEQANRKKLRRTHTRRACCTGFCLHVAALWTAGKGAEAALIISQSS